MEETDIVGYNASDLIIRYIPENAKDVIMSPHEFCAENKEYFFKVEINIQDLIACAIPNVVWDGSS